MSNNFESFSTLPIELQIEALREGEVRLQAQLEIANAADQRALSWTNLILVTSTASLGGLFALINSQNPNYFLIVIAAVFSTGASFSAWVAITTIQPELFCLPGNMPGSWRPEEWACKGSERKKIEASRREQAEQINSHILENADQAKRRALRIKLSFKIIRITIPLCLILSVAYAAFFVLSEFLDIF